MTKSRVKSLKWIGLMSGVGLIALSTATFASSSAPAAAPVVSTNLQVADTQQPLKKQPPPQKQPLQQQQPKQQQVQQQKQPLQQQQPKQQMVQQQKQPLQQTQQQGARYDWAAYQPGHRPPQAQQYGQNFDPRPYQMNRDSGRRYQSQRYMQPEGWYSQRWVYGETLPPLFWGRSYWLTSYWDFGLMNPPYGYVWVRDGADALLVDVETGQILSVEYGVFA
jgi:Ni/Co efflux regulator RcnB